MQRPTARSREGILLLYSQKGSSLRWRGVSYVWLGGTDEEEEGVWSWVDGSPWGYSNWGNLGGGKLGKGQSCMFMKKGQNSFWEDYSCTYRTAFLCQQPYRVIKGNTTLEYSIRALTFSSIYVAYSYTFHRGMLDSWEDKRMTGFQLSWRIENPKKLTTISELGRSIKTPGFREKGFGEFFYSADRAYKVTLVLPENIEVGTGTLVIQLEVDTRDDNRWQEEVRYPKTAKWGPEKYKLYTNQKSWSDAEAHCQAEGGHLASVLSEGEQKELSTMADGQHVWIGGTDAEQEGVWKWTNNGSWAYNN